MMGEAGNILPTGTAGLSARDEADVELRVARAIAQHAADAIFLLDQEGRTTFANPAAEQMFGWSQAELHGRQLHDIIHYKHADGRPFPMCDCPLGQVFTTGQSLRFHEDVFFRRDGSAVHVTCSNAAILDDGKVAGGVLIVRDVTERHKAEEHRRLLVHELDHRVKNTLAIVQSIAQQSFRGTDMQACRAAFEGRLSALAAAHNLLTDSSWTATPLRDVADAAIRPFSLTQERFSVSGPSLMVPPKTAVVLAMALHELATNATKYGALSADTGHISLSWSIAAEGEQPELHLTWQEHGGPPVQRPKRFGFGSRMIEKGLANELQGAVSIDFLPDGVRCDIRAPLPDQL